MERRRIGGGKKKNKRVLEKRRIEGGEKEDRRGKEG